MMIEPYGGAIVAVAPQASAFVHRHVSMDLVFEAIWYDEADRAPAIAWLDVVRDRFAGYVNGHVYQNYPRRGLDNYQLALLGRELRNVALGQTQVRPRERVADSSRASHHCPMTVHDDCGRVLFSDPGHYVSVPGR